MKEMEFKGNFIDGKFILPESNAGRLASEDPGDLDHPVGAFQFSEGAVDSAVEAARRAFPLWSRRSFAERAKYLMRFKQVLKKHSNELVLLISREMGKVISESGAEVVRILAKIDNARREETALVSSTEHRMGSGLVGRLRFRPRGVLVILAPFNLPAYLASAQIIPALLQGNTVVFKPSEITPFVGQFLASLWKEAGLPKGVFNLVQGPGNIGRALVLHPQIDGVIFTGSWATGSQIQAQLLSQPQKMCALEMGGKNCAMVLGDADLPAAIEETVTGTYLTTGQRCNATSRIAVERAVAERFIDGFLKRADQIRVGYSTEPGAWMGPVASRAALRRIEGFLNQAPSEGFEVLIKSTRVEHKPRGYYLSPSVHLRRGIPAKVPTDGSYADEEVFGPDVAIYVVKDLDEALCLNNRSRYGLVTSIFTRSRAKFEKTLREAESGLVHWNVATTRSSGRLPFGGLKRSGNGRPAGFFSPYLCTIPTASVEKSRP